MIELSLDRRYHELNNLLTVSGFECGKPIVLKKKTIYYKFNCFCLFIFKTFRYSSWRRYRK